MPNQAKLGRKSGLATVVDFFRSLLPSKTTKREEGSQPRNQNAPGFRLDIRHGIHPYQQEHSYSCGAAVMQAVSNHLGKELTHAQAIRLTRCKPNGATLERVAEAMMTFHSCVVRRLKQATAIRCAIADGAMILAGDKLTYVDDHAILLYGFTHEGFFYLDPARGATFWQQDKWFFDAGDEFIAIRARKSRCRKDPSRHVYLHKCNGLTAFGKDAKIIANITGLPLHSLFNERQPRIHFSWDWSKPIFKRLAACNVSYAVLK